MVGLNIETYCDWCVYLHLQLGILLAVRLAMLQGSLPKFSQQDNPTAFHPSLYVR